MKTFDKTDWMRFFPFPTVRLEQEQAINFALDAYINKGKKYVLLNCGTGVGKSAIAVCIARYLNEFMPTDTGFTPGSYVLTTQKVLQEQYLSDYGPGKAEMLSIKSASNFGCLHHTNQSCGESKRVLNAMGKQLVGTDFFKTCRNHCPYTIAKKAFLDCPLSTTNYSYFLAETMYAGALEPRNLLIMDEFHNAQNELGKFIEVTFAERFARDRLKVKVPKLETQEDVFNWITKTYRPSLAKHKQELEDKIENELVSGMAIIQDMTKEYELLDKHLCKVNRFIMSYDANNWVMNVVRSEPSRGRGTRPTRGGRKFEFKPVDVSPYGDDMLFKFGKRVLVMSATLLDKAMTCSAVGIDQNDAEFLDIDSPFPVENHPIHYLPVGKMSNSDIDKTLPKVVEVLREIMKSHLGDKGIFHCSSFRVANYVRDNLRDGRLLVQTEGNREDILRKHIASDQPTVLVSPSMTEGVDLKDDLSRFQVFVKLPYPHLKDLVVERRMKNDENWYSFVTARSIIQGVGRSIRNETDNCQTYIVDECFGNFYRQNRKFFPKSFQASVNM